MCICVCSCICWFTFTGVWAYGLTHLEIGEQTRVDQIWYIEFEYPEDIKKESLVWWHVPIVPVLGSGNLLSERLCLQNLKNRTIKEDTGVGIWYWNMYTCITHTYTHFEKGGIWNFWTMTTFIMSISSSFWGKKCFRNYFNLQRRNKDPDCSGTF